MSNEFAAGYSQSSPISPLPLSHTLREDVDPVTGLRAIVRASDDQPAQGLGVDPVAREMATAAGSSAGVLAAVQGMDATQAAAAGTKIVEAPAILRGTVRATAGLTLGALGATTDAAANATRAANAVQLQANLDAACDQKKFFEFEPCEVQIKNTAGIKDKPSWGGVQWHGSLLSVIKQYQQDAPILTFGSFNKVSGCSSYVIDGVNCQYAEHQITGAVPNANAKALLLGSMCWSTLANIIAGSKDARPHTPVHIAGAASWGFFNNTLSNIQCAGGYVNLFNCETYGTGNVYETLYCAAGNVDQALAVSDIAVKFWTSRIDEQVINQLNVEHTIAGHILSMQSARSFVINSLHMEYCGLNGYDSAFLYLSSADANVKGWTIRNPRVRNSYAGVAGATIGAQLYPALVNGFGPRSLKAETVTLVLERNNGAHELGLAKNLHVFGHRDAPSQTRHQPPQYVFEHLQVEGPDAPSTAGFLQIDKYTPSATYGFPKRVSKLSTARLVCASAEAEFERTSDFTVWGMHADADVNFPAALGAAKTVTLAKFLDAPGGKRAATPVKTGSTVRVVRQAGAVDAFSLAVKNHDGATVGTLAAADSEAWFAFNGADWVAA